jgi:hypothetical protein
MGGLPGLQQASHFELDVVIPGVVEKAEAPAE